MSTRLHDVPGQGQITTLLEPQTLTATATSASADLVACDGRCFAMLLIGEVSGTDPVLNAKLQESANNSTWTDIAGAAFTAVTGSDVSQVIAFDRGKRYVRLACTITGTSPSFVLAAVVGQQIKQSGG